MASELDPRGISVNECQGVRYLHAEGYSTEVLSGFLGVRGDTVARHVRGDCDCPDDADPLPFGVVTGEELRSKRLELNLTQGEFADRVGVSTSTVWAWEKGKMRPRRNRAHAIARALEEETEP